MLVYYNTKTILYLIGPGDGIVKQKPYRARVTIETVINATLNVT